MGKKVVYRIFTIADYDREAAYLKDAWPRLEVEKVNYSPL